MSTEATQTQRVLVVDDEPEVTLALQVYFMGKGYEMLTALNGIEAMKLVREHPIHLVLLDMKMPGVNGIEVLKFVHAQSPSTKVIVITAYDVQFQEMVEQLGVDGFLTKPFGIQALTGTVEEVLAGKRLSQLAAPQELSIEPGGLIPKAKLLFVEPAEYTYKLKEVFFQNPEKCKGQFQLAVAYSSEEMFRQLKSFRPDILVVDLSLLGTSGDLAAQAMKSPARPKELIIHGSKSLFSAGPGVNVNRLSNLGVKLVQNESFTRAGLVRLAEVVRKTAVSHHLMKKR